MSVELPDSFDFFVDLDLTGIPSNYTLTLNPVTVSPMSLTIAPLTFDVRPITIQPMDVSLRLKEIPSIRAHFPVDYRVGLSVLGSELVCLRLCGQSQVITEPYLPNPCEVRGGSTRAPGLAELDRLVAEKEAGNG
jgi:hypothetical protein